MRRLVTSMACLLLLTGFAGNRMALAAGPGQQSAAAATEKAAPQPSDFVGQDTCATCHEDVVKKFGTNPHSRLTLEHAGKGVTCESCPGPGKAHVEGGGDVTKIRRFTKMTTTQIDETCLGCHGGAHANFPRSEHAKQGVGCTSCHSVHAAETPEHLLKAEQPKLCFQCHTDVKPAFSQPFHHRVEEGLIACSDCHDPHGTFNRKNLRSTADQNAICTKCHSETAGPFAYEHPVVKAEGCVSCHSPHGSPNARLLNVGNVNTLCLQCHSETNTAAFPHAVSPVGPVHNQSAQYVACTTCHTQIHGSNASDVFFK
ncbi:MAG TPA: DmsE family decaheme c-type cytochrome [Acidobacteriaceae bacterium]|nr:DmsE family decaheme c-type cytochrome [Acidobacteriaceae bacterium]